MVMPCLDNAEHAYVGVDENGCVRAVAWRFTDSIGSVAREMAEWSRDLTVLPCAIEHAQTFDLGDRWQPERAQPIPPLLALMGVEC